MLIFVSDRLFGSIIQQICVETMGRLPCDIAGAACAIGGQVLIDPIKNLIYFIDVVTANSDVETKQHIGRQTLSHFKHV